MSMYDRDNPHHERLRENLAAGLYRLAPGQRPTTRKPLPPITERRP